jgi:cytochrome c553
MREACSDTSPGTGCVNRVRRGLALGVSLGLALWGAAAAAEDAIGGDMVVTKGMKPWEGCGECHDLDGVAPNGHFPNLAAQKPSYLRKEMDDFRKGGRDNDHGQMGTSAREAAGATLDAVVGYFAGLPPPPPAPMTDLGAKAAARAALLVAKGSRADRIPPCVNCHSPHPKRAFDAPWLEAQQPAYLVKQLEEFRSSARANDPDEVMEKIARVLSDDDIAALAQYLASLPRPPAAAQGVAESGGSRR